MDTGLNNGDRRGTGVLLACVVITALVPHLPFGSWLAWPLRLLSTLAHEMGHGVAAVLVGGSFLRFQMWPDGSGVASTVTDGGRMATALVSAGGLVGPAVAATALFLVARRVRGSRATVGVIAGVLALTVLLVVRGWFGVLFVTIVCAGLAAVFCYASAATARFTLVFIAVQLAASVFSRADYLFTPVAQTHAGSIPSDVAVISQALLLPYWFWGVVCGALSAAVLVVGLCGYLGRGR